MKLRNVLMLVAASLFLVLAQMTTGSVAIPLDSLWNALLLNPNAEHTHLTILWDSRIPRTLAAVFAGASLSWSGMLMQTLFRNPLAGPSMLGISSGASLGVALLVLGSGGTALWVGLLGSAGIATAAFLGAFAMLVCVLLVSTRFNDESTLRAYVSWGMGNFGDCNYTEIALMAFGLLVSSGISLLLLPRLNLLLLGENYAKSMGVDVKQTRIWMMLATGIMAGCATAFCGPVSFIGLAVPHLSRWLTQSADHRKNILPTLWLGALLALGCDWLSRMSTLPLNTIASALGAPFVVLLVLKWKRFRPLI